MEISNSKRYNTLNSFLREKFGEKVFKISLDAGFTCPNRDGKISTGGCIFCSPRGSGDFAGNNKNLVEQFCEVKQMMNRKWKKGKYIAYFQAYTNTYASKSELRDKYYSVLELDNVVGIAIATRPDCLDEEILELLTEVNSKKYLWVELGLQTINEKTSKIINRGYELSQYVNAVKVLKKRNIDVVTHIILGLPQEEHEDIIRTIEYVANTGTQGVKLHLLHVLKGTKLEGMYNTGELELLSKERYVELIVDCIERLPRDMIIHRITGDGPRETLLAPMWSLKKWEVLNAIDYLLMDKNTYQGHKYKVNNSVQGMFE